METETKQGDDILTKALSVFVNLKLFVCHRRSLKRQM